VAGNQPPRAMSMSRTALLLLSVVVTCLAQLNLRRVNLLATGLWGEVNGRVLCWDSDHNGRRELLFSTGTINPGNPRRWEVWEYRPVNWYELVFADTGVYPYPNGIATGNLVPFDVGDIDQDGRTDIVGVNRERANDTLYNVLVVMESPDEHSLPESLVWSFRYGRNLGGVSPCYIAPDLDRDGKREAVLLGGQYVGRGVWEPAGNNQYELVWDGRGGPSMGGLAFGDFDMDSLREFAGGFEAAAVYENTAPRQDSYVLTFTENPNVGSSTDQFSGQDLDQDGWPEFLISYYAPWTDTYTLMMWEATGNNAFERTLVDERRMVVGYGGGRSRCGDLDGNGVDELAWALPLGLFVYKAVGNNEFEQVWEWWDDHGGTSQCLITNIADMNGNGYNELVVGGSGKTSVFEVEAIRVLHPDTSEEFCPGDTCLVRWQTFTPPRCDSVSLFLLTDTVVPEGEWFWNMDTIVTGLPPGDTTYPWVVPDTVLDAAWIVAIAYGPGWQFDCSDHPFSIIPSGVAERPKPVTSGPVPEPTIVGGLLWLGQSGDRPSVGGTVPVLLLDAAGRIVMELRPGPNDIRHVAPGVYFVREDSRGQGLSRQTAPARTRSEGSSVRKVVVQK
jgi:hypothetical protein